jgi:NAD+ kinase
MSNKFFDSICVIDRKGDPVRVSDDIDQIKEFIDSAVGPVTLVNKEYIDENTLVVALGGDGTVMNAGRVAASKGCPVLGINLGTLGFLAEFEHGDTFNLLNDLYHNENGDFSIQERWMLKAVLYNESRDPKYFDRYAINDIYVKSADGDAMVTYTLEVNGNESGTHSADCIIVNSATGSTAYAMAAGGAFMMPTMKAMQIVPVAPHVLTTRPLIVSEDHQVTLKFSGDRPIRVFIDGREMEVDPKDGQYVISVGFNANKFRLVKRAGERHSFFEVIKDKFH